MRGEIALTKPGLIRGEISPNTEIIGYLVLLIVSYMENNSYYSRGLIPRSLLRLCTQGVISEMQVAKCRKWERSI